ncbi:unnamed protein product [Chondrus crispus]|uniref:Uncharacterized protein n=1 Tax=Chondrus crispus TaxID=2769 RepID=R7QL16_CHOCR|nr:unnamed protein product [Chondrus crispus]CDF39212.1 unnamed protein product [Chondrus crispus]|eukprot:XP_005719123.1 unnamed protein product [Chondrus crispus]
MAVTLPSTSGTRTSRRFWARSALSLTRSPATGLATSRTRASRRPASPSDTRAPSCRTSPRPPPDPCRVAAARLGGSMAQSRCIPRCIPRRTPCSGSLLNAPIRTSHTPGCPPRSLPSRAALPRCPPANCLPYHHQRPALIPPSTQHSNPP